MTITPTHAQMIRQCRLSVFLLPPILMLCSSKPAVAAGADPPAETAALKITLGSQPPQEPPPASAPPPAPASPEGSSAGTGGRRKLPPLGVNVGAFFPTSTKTRNRFGSSWLSFGPGVGSIVPTSKGQFQPDISFLVQRREAQGFNNRAGLLLLGVDYRVWLVARSVPDSVPIKFLPFAGVSADVLVAFIRSAFDDVDGTGAAVAGSAFVGAAVGKSAFVEARYRFASSVKGFDFSGAAVRVGVRF